MGPWTSHGRRWERGLNTFLTRPVWYGVMLYSLQYVIFSLIRVNLEMVRGCAGSPSELTLVTLLTSQGNVLTRTTHKAARGVRLYLLMRSDFVLEP